MKISGTKSYIRVSDFEGKSMIIKGEMTMNGFVAEKTTMTQWEDPNSQILVTDNERERIIKAIIEETKSKNFKIQFE